ncbi:hypothetical protein B0H12DRAFT_592308 [Mycena haematopus]|nr:hypothetical protein B0H12DRAFT_592308 [Mycena haematopus]
MASSYPKSVPARETRKWRTLRNLISGEVDTQMRSLYRLLPQAQSVRGHGVTTRTRRTRAVAVSRTANVLKLLFLPFLSILPIHPSAPILELPWTTYNFLDLRQHPETVYVDKTRCIPQLPGTFRLILLRPPRFGKTTFLSTLQEYYDVRGTDEFYTNFGSLAATSEIRDHSQHLCLSFAMSSITDLSDLAGIRAQLTSLVWRGLRTFTAKYAAELKYFSPEMFPKYTDVDCNIIDWFAMVFNLVRERGYTLFVGVDDYDAPIQQRSFIHPDYFARARDIESLLDTCFWAPLRTGIDVIAKLFVTGTLSLAASPNLVHLGMLDLKEDPLLRLSCGFTEQEALTFAAAFLDKPFDIVGLSRAYGSYMFLSSHATAEPVLHPQELIQHIAELSRKPIMPYTEPSFPLLADLFERLPEDSDDFGIVSTNGLVDLLASGTIKIDGDATPDSYETLTWKTLHHLGVLTYDCEGELRVANETVLTLVSPAFQFALSSLTNMLSDPQPHRPRLHRPLRP